MLLASISESIVNETAHFVRTAGLPGIFVLMAASSACIPIPSEAVMLFAGFVVADKAGSGSEHHLTMVGVVLVGVIGTLVGSWLAYAVGRGGRLELFERHGDKFHMGPAQIERADRWFQRHGQQIVLYGRVVPVIRAFVSLPAGIAKMPLGRFTVLTMLGSLPWVLGFALAGHALGGDWKSVRNGLEYVDYVLLAAIVLGFVYWRVHRRNARADRAAVAETSVAEAVDAAEPPARVGTPVD
jgi:membrane protein DedA with SNARE-associated domain